MRSIKKCLLVLLLLAGAAAARPAGAASIGTAFSYQGQLEKSGAPYTGAADMKFRLFADSTGAQIGSDFSAVGVPVTGGLFTVRLDFGNVWTGQALWLETDVRTPGDPGYTTLSPRTAILAVPYAVRALNGPSGSSQWNNGAYGIDYSAGNVGLGTIAHGGRKLYVNTGSASINPVWIVNNDVSHAALVVQNTAAGGYGIYDDQSDQHYFAGAIGINVLAPAAGLHSLGAEAIRGESYGGIIAGVTKAGVHGVGGGGGIFGYSAGVVGESTGGNGVEGTATTAGQYGGYFKNTAGGAAIFADGIAKVKTLQILGGADLAEPFEVASADGVAAEPGTVVVIDAANPGDLRVSGEAYDSRVAGVISGANDLAPGMVMKSEHDACADGSHPVALTGRVWCKVDASFGAVQPGDLLTTSSTAGHAMKASDAGRRAGAVIGKAMTSLETGRGLVLVLVNLQ